MKEKLVFLVAFVAITLQLTAQKNVGAKIAKPPVRYSIRNGKLVANGKVVNAVINRKKTISSIGKLKNTSTIKVSQSVASRGYRTCQRKVAPTARLAQKQNNAIRSSYIPSKTKTYSVAKRAPVTSIQSHASAVSSYTASTSSAGGNSASVAYLDVLRQYAKYDKCPDFGKIVKSEKSENKYTGQEVYNFIYDSGWNKSLSVSKCPLCFGNGRCRGVSHSFLPLYGVPYYCTECGNSGNCMFCGGSGKWVSVLASNAKLGLFYGFDGKLSSTNSSSTGSNVGSSVGSGYSVGSSSGSSTKSRRVCPSCGGKGRGSDQITYAPDYTGNSTVYCSTCGTTGARHSHHASLCRVCNGRGYVE